MPGPSGHADPPEPARGVSALLGRLPVALRYGFYTLFFLTFLLVLLPWLAYRIDTLVPCLHVEVGWVVRGAGIVLFVLFLAAYVASSHLLTSRGHGGHVEFDPPREFVASGVYRWVRNPIAGSAVCMLLAEALAFSSMGIFFLFIAAALVAHLQVTLLEEPLLRKRFGDSYTVYLGRVPRWVPRRPRGAG
jgi:protein-S-isoprenylcysteine O-methyltransferase Ste14